MVFLKTWNCLFFGIFRLQQNTGIRKMSDSSLSNNQQPQIVKQMNNSNGNNPSSYNADGTRDATSDFSAHVSTETIIMAGNDTEMRIVSCDSHNYPQQFLGVPPPPAFANHFNTNIDTNATDKSQQ